MNYRNFDHISCIPLVLDFVLECIFHVLQLHLIWIKMKFFFCSMAFNTIRSLCLPDSVQKLLKPTNNSNPINQCRVLHSSLTRLWSNLDQPKYLNWEIWTKRFWPKCLNRKIMVDLTGVGHHNKHKLPQWIWGSYFTLAWNIFYSSI